jgi:predicted transcriptional regulator of viral defense system
MVMKGKRMDYLTFRDKYCAYPIIDSHSVALSCGEPAVSVRNQLLRWADKGMLLRLKRGMYAFNARDRKGGLDVLYIANQLYTPSYVSLEWALSYYGLIPERVTMFTSVSLKKTQKFETDLGVFEYRSITKKAFTGFRVAPIERGGKDVLIAEPEKALVDFCYYRRADFSGNVQDVAVESFRFQSFDELSAEKMMAFAALFDNKRLARIVGECAGLIGRI